MVFQIDIHKSKKNNKYYKKKLTNKKTNRHIFYIVDCYVRTPKYLNNKYLYNYLVQAGLLPDNAMSVISRRYEALLKKYKIKKDALCRFDNHIKQLKELKLEDGIVNADVFFFIDNPKLDRMFYKYHTYFSNILSNEIYKYIDKDYLYDSVVKYNPTNIDILKYFIKVFPLSKQDKIIFPGNYILRPIHGFAGKDILYIHNEDDLKLANKYYDRAKDYKQRPYKINEIMVSHIITDLALFKGRKFHIRMYYLVSFINGIVNSFLFDIGEIITAKLQFNTNLPFSKDVHDTHAESTDADYFYPKDFNEVNLGLPITKKILDELMSKCMIICSGITNVFKAHKNKILFENQDNGYYLYGIDVLVKSNFEPVIIEINGKPSFGMKTLENSEYMSKILYGWINEIAIEPLFKYNKPQLARKHPTYINV
jgi:hypothetical protein